MKKALISLPIIFSLFFIACGGGNENTNFTNSTENDASNQNSDETTANGDNPSYDPNRGEGKYTQVDLDEKLNVALADAGEKIQSVKCASCHKLSDERLVGPGWKGVTQRRKPEWIMNFITNPAPMIDKDPELQKQLEICMVRMPNQSLSDDEARNILEFMRKNDGVQ